MLPESRLYSFLHQEFGCALHFLEGQRLIQDLALIHHLTAQSLSSFRDAVLSLQPLIALLKPHEGLGLYLDIEAPYLRFKLETNYEGYLRTLLYPQDIGAFPDKLNGIARVSKLLPGHSSPYNSAIPMENLPTKEITSFILEQSYQTPGRISVAEQTDQSFLFLRLPRPNVNKEEVVERAPLEELFRSANEATHFLFSRNTTDPQMIQKHFENMGYLYLGSRQVKFKCSCSKERMLMGIASLVASSGYDDLFPNGQTQIETKCDYCNSYYQIEKNQVQRFRDELN